MKIAFKLVLHLLLFILTWICCNNIAYGQFSSIRPLERLNFKNQEYSLLEKPIDNVSKNNKKRTLGYGINLEGLSGSIFCQNTLGRTNHDLGIRIGAGYNATSFIILAGNRFSTKYSLRYDERDTNNGEFFYEFIWIDLYLDKQINNFSFQYGIRFSKFGHSTDQNIGRIGGDFLGFYVQPTIGKGMIRIGSRIQWGILKDRTMNKDFQTEFAVIGSPVVLILKFR